MWIDVKIFSLQKFIQLCSKADTNALDLLFSFTNEEIEKYKPMKTINGEHKSIIRYIYENRNKLINTDRLESPITYAYKQATKYSLKGNYLNLYDELLNITKDFTDDKTVLDLIEYFDIKQKLWEKDLCVITKGVKEKGGELTYLSVCGVEHQSNLPIRTFEERIKSKINQYSKRSIESMNNNGNDWKALSHAVRVLLEVQELMETGNITFPLLYKDLLLEIKQGKVSRETVEEIFKDHLSGLMECIAQDTLTWKYDEEFWNKFILQEIKKMIVTKV